jgi:hypothetical protein
VALISSTAFCETQPLAVTSNRAATPAFSVVEMLFFMTSFPFFWVGQKWTGAIEFHAS